MGCDIHIHCEYRDDDGIWHNCDNHIWDEDNEEFVVEDIYWGRNYDLFGILAGVRSREYPMISPPRGIPHDISAKTKEFADMWRGDAHSYSYVTMKELIKWKKVQTRKWKKLKKNESLIRGHDDCYGDYIVNENDEPIFKKDHHMLDYLIKLLKIKMDKYFFCFDSEDFYDKGDNFRIVFWFDN